MFEQKLKYYLCASGEVKKRANQHRKTFTKLRRNLYQVVESLGASRGSMCDSMMLIRGIVFDGAVPAGWTKKGRHGLSRPKLTKDNAEILKHFTPSGSYRVDRHPDLQAFEDWLGCPTGYKWTKPAPSENSGYCGIGALFADSVAYWYSADCPIKLVLPDVKYYREEARREGKIVEGNVLNWKPKPGMREILKEEYELMKAKDPQKEIKKAARELTRAKPLEKRGKKVTVEV